MEPLQSAFRALADPTRRGILTLLAQSEMTIGEVTEAFPMTRAAVKKHLTILEEGRLIEVEPRGRERVNRLRPGALKPVSDWITQLDAAWDDRLADLKSAIERDLQ
ncbi:MAG: metalloregulator ArsR/SmtB family transcription factor [Rhodobacter sp.]|nr:metalloregulator ArsR/SmtB family transcription factor [Rhodobacter sp.]